MSDDSLLPRVLVIDDLFGRTVVDGRNEERANLCAQFLLRDVSGDEDNRGAGQIIKRPIAEVVFFRAQRPVCATVGDVVENDLAATMRVIETGWHNAETGTPMWSLVLLDLCFYTGPVTHESNADVKGMPAVRRSDEDPSSYFGLYILEAIQERFPDLPVIILSSKPRAEVSRRFACLGALDFLPRADDESPERLRELVRLHGLIPDGSGEIVGRSHGLLLALRTARRAAIDRRNVLVRGETGTGKELLARYCNQNGPPQARGKLVVVNSAGLTRELYASELFGHVRGAFTGAHVNRIGRILEADKGDLFLDEIGSMPPEVQAGVLRVLELREVVHVGGQGEPIKADVRFIFATNEDLESRVTRGEFRSDLLYRLRESGTILLPPLRERSADIPLLVERFVREAEAVNRMAVKREVDVTCYQKLRGYPWPGNVRELRNCVFHAIGAFPGVEHMMPHHLILPSVNPTPVTTGPAISAIAGPAAVEVPLLRPEVASAAEIAGKLPVYARLIATLVQAALKVTAKPTPDNLEGKISITRAIQLISGDATIKTAKAADILKRVLQIDPTAVRQMLDDPVLREAYETAVRLRPGRSNRPRSTDSSG